MKPARVGTLALATFFLASITRAQIVPIITKVNIPPAVERKALSVGLELTQNAAVERVLFRYRSFGASEYKELEMLLAGRTATVSLAADVVLPPYLEYFVQIELAGGKRSYYPLVGGRDDVPPESTPLQIQVNPSNPKDQEAIILSPEPGETAAAEELGISISLFYATDVVNKNATRIILDGVDVSKDAVRFEDLITYTPRNFDRPLNLGAHFLRIELRDTSGKLYHTIESTFNLSTAAAIAEQKARLSAFGSGQLEYRNENVSSVNTTYARGDFRTDANYSFMNFGGSIHIDNQDQPSRQPQNRFLLYGDARYLRVEVGDAFPKFPSLIVSGKRVRGVTANLATGYFNVDFSMGQTERSIEGILADTLIRYYKRDSTGALTNVGDSSAVNARPANSIPAGNYFTYRAFTGGTFTRNFVAVRPSFGSGENFQLGFTYMHAKDDVGSILYGITPGENLVAGSDLLIAFDDQHVKWETQASLGVQNTDISKGSFSQADYDSMKAQGRGKSYADSVKAYNDGKDLENLGKLVDKYITVNANLQPINPIASGLPGVSLESIFSLNYFNNFLRTMFFRRGAAYKSFGNEFLQTDIQGIQLSDYLRLFANRVFLSVSYEQKHDNTTNSPDRATTTYSNLNTSLTLNIDARYPSLQVGYGTFTRNADLDDATRLLLVNRPDSASARKSADDATTRVFVGSNYEFTAGIRHSLSLAVSSTNKQDNTINKKNQNNLFAQASLTSRFQSPFQTTLSFVLSNNANDQEFFYGSTNLIQRNRDSLLTTTNFNYSTVGLNAQYRMLDDNLRLFGTIAPSFGALQRTALQIAADWTIQTRHNFVFQYDFISNTGIANDQIVSLIYRFSF